MGPESGHGLAGSCASRSLAKQSRWLRGWGLIQRLGWRGSASKLTYRTWMLEGFSFLQIGLRASVPCWLLAGALSSLLCGHYITAATLSNPVKESASRIEVSASSNLITEGTSPLSSLWVKSKSLVLPTCQVTQGSEFQEIGTVGWEIILETAWYRIKLHGASLLILTFLQHTFKQIEVHGRSKVIHFTARRDFHSEGESDLNLEVVAPEFPYVRGLGMIGGQSDWRAWGHGKHSLGGNA